MESGRPLPLRPFDQIAIEHLDLARQAELVAPSFADSEVVFVGDYDGMSMMLGLLGAEGEAAIPARMTVLDFDERLLEHYEDLARRHRFMQHFEARLWNAFDPVPADLAGQFDAFYTNPPYGSRNRGGSQRLFLARGMELVRQGSGVFGYAVLPYDDARPCDEGGDVRDAGLHGRSRLGRQGDGLRHARVPPRR